MVPQFYRATKKKSLIQSHPGGLLLERENPSPALQTEALQSWTSRKVARPPVCSFSMAWCIMGAARVRGGADTGRITATGSDVWKQPRHLRRSGFLDVQESLSLDKSSTFQQCCKTAFSAEISFKVKLMSNYFITGLSFSFISPGFSSSLAIWFSFGFLSKQDKTFVITVWGLGGFCAQVIN